MKFVVHLVAVLLSINVSYSGFGLDCPARSEIHRYVFAPLRVENKGSDTQSLKIYYQLLNAFDAKKPTVLLLNGGPGGDHRILQLFKDSELSQVANILSFDHRGLGCTHIQGPQSVQYEKLIYGMSRSADDLEFIRKDLLGENGDWFVYGLSYGTLLGQTYALKYPKHLKGLILDSAFHEVESIQIARKKFLPTFLEEIPEIKELYHHAIKKFPTLEAKILRVALPKTYSQYLRTFRLINLFDSVLKADIERDAEEYLETQEAFAPPMIGMTLSIFCEELWDYPALNTPENKYYWWAFALQCPAFESKRSPMRYAEKLKSLKVPTFIWGGKYDPVTPIESMHAMKSLIPNAFLWENPHAGHGLIGEKKICALKLAKDFIHGESSKALLSTAYSTDCQSPSEMDNHADSVEPWWHEIGLGDSFW